MELTIFVTDQTLNCVFLNDTVPKLFKIHSARKVTNSFRYNINYFKLCRHEQLEEVVIL